MSSTVVCFERYRRERNQPRAHRPAERAQESPFRRYSGGRERVLNDRQIAHRRQMLDHLAPVLCRIVKLPMRGHE